MGSIRINVFDRAIVLQLVKVAGVKSVGLLQTIKCSKHIPEWFLKSNVFNSWCCLLWQVLLLVVQTGGEGFAEHLIC